VPELRRDCGPPLAAGVRDVGVRDEGIRDGVRFAWEGCLGGWMGGIL